MQSCIYEGWVRHRRFTPRRHAFVYGMAMMYLDLEELPALFNNRWLWSSQRFAPAWFRRRDHFGDTKVPLDQAVRDLVEARTGHRPDGPIRLLTHLRYLGYVFNPVSFYYCFDAPGEAIEAIVAEVNNTPWGERHCYVLDEQANQGTQRHKRFSQAKAFYVSPFMPMNQTYHWRLTAPGATLAVHIENEQEGRKVFDATLSLRRREINGAALARVLMLYHAITLKVSAAIYWQAARLWLKRCPVYDHPATLKSS